MDILNVNKNVNKHVVKSTLMAVLIAGVGWSGQVSAASACKGLETAECGARNSCSWVNSYQRKDGRSVKGFCRTKAKRVAVKAKTLEPEPQPVDQGQ